jgi:hypothetical protein
MRYGHFRVLLLMLGLLVVVLAGCGTTVAGGTTEATATEAPAPPTPTATPIPHYKVGDQVMVGTTWLITIHGVTVSSGDSSYMPPAGKVLLIFDIGLMNRTSQAAPAGGAADWSLRDDSGTLYKAVSTAYGEPPSGSVEAGEESRGDLVVEVPNSVHQFLLMYAPAAGGDLAIWDITAVVEA